MLGALTCTGAAPSPTQSPATWAQWACLSLTTLTSWPVRIGPARLWAPLVGFQGLGGGPQQLKSENDIWVVCGQVVAFAGLTLVCKPCKPRDVSGSLFPCARLRDGQLPV